MKNLILQFSVLFATIIIVAYYAFKTVVASYKERDEKRENADRSIKLEDRFKKRQPSKTKAAYSSGSST